MYREISSSNPLDFKEEEHELNATATHGYEKPPMADLIKVSVKLVFMIFSLVAILTPGGVDKIFYWSRLAVRFPRTLDITYLSLGLGSGAVLVIAIAAYFGFRKKGKKVVFVGTENAVVGEIEAEIQSQNVDVKSPVSPISSLSGESWKPISGLDVKLVLEYCPVESKSLAKKDKMENCSETRNGSSMQKEERRTRRKSMSCITQNYEDASVGSSPFSYEKASFKRGEKAMPLRRSSRIQALSTPSDGRMLISSRG